MKSLLYSRSPSKPFTKYVHKDLAEFKRPPWVPLQTVFLELGPPGPPPRQPSEHNNYCKTQYEKGVHVTRKLLSISKHVHFIQKLYDISV